MEYGEVTIKGPKENGLSGTVEVPPSKSYSHRMFFAALLEVNRIIIENALTLGDTARTLTVCKKLGMIIRNLDDKENRLECIPPNRPESDGTIIDCGNSGTTVRIVTALSPVIKGKLVLSGEFFDRDRPINELIGALRPFNPEFTVHRKDGRTVMELLCNPIDIPEKVTVTGKISSQYITGLMFLGHALLKGKIPDLDAPYKFTVEIPDGIKSFPYLLITADVLKQFGTDVNFIGAGGVTVIGGRYNGPMRIELKREKSAENKGNDGGESTPTYTVEGDFSSAAFPAVAAALFGKKDRPVILKNLNTDSVQGDRRIFDILKENGIKVEVSGDGYSVYGRNEDVVQNGKHRTVYIDFTDNPDLFPILCVFAAYSAEKFVMENIEHIRLKESDRAALMEKILRTFGIECNSTTDKMEIGGIGERNHPDDIGDAPVVIDTRLHGNDHRIIMASTILALGYTGNGRTVTIKNAGFVADSYPRFFDDLRAIGVDIDYR